MALKLVTPPVEEPVNLEEIKMYLRIDGSDFDSMLSSLIRAAREYCEAFQNRAYITQEFELVFDEFPQMPLSLPRPPLQSVINILYINQDGVETVLDPSNYLVDLVSEPGRIAFAHGKSWPSVVPQPVNAVKIRYVAGYGAANLVPENIKMAIKLFVAHRFENPETSDVPDAVHFLLWPDRVVPV